ncbi:phosphatidylinositol 3,4,5-trisphosphate 5-phosphatase 2A-like [Saccoglossus kowalevskii]|uniref:Phosphatidylinositol 3,4,5-trisphosphate 5-phosphatase 2-like n=1 Tax=Saccoglossus kowalevskii TaxID=10224 RepID=A0ABM0MGK3_SACKO|nr:PREDICTED: phosphatidylinositol 3,4,5-trisphosphate 5-phosphatase 2-like [Saccoglossus kowalevskii]
MSNNKYCLEFRSNCMEGKQKSKANREWVTGSGLHDSSARPRWSSKEIPELIPAIPDYEYLEDQHIFVAVKSEDSDEYFGECVLALKFKFGSLPSSFKATLSHLGEVTGKIMGKMHVKTDEKLLRTMTSKRRGKSYELVSIEETGSSHPPCLQDASLLTVDTVNSHEAYTSPSVPRKKVILQSQSFDVTPQLPPSTSTKHRPYSCHYGMQPPAAEAAINESFHWGKTSVPSDIATPPMLPVRHHIPFDRQASEPSSKLHKPPLPVRNISIIPEQENLSSEQAQDVQIAATTKKVEPEEEDDDTSYFEYPPGPPVPPRQGINAMLGRTLPPVPLPPAPKQSQGNLPPLPPLPTSMNKAVDITEDDKEVCEDYETLTWPKTISEWLMNLGLPQYVTRLMDNGWDSVVFLDSIMNSDLIEAGVTNEEHRQRMLKSVADMKQQ